METFKLSLEIRTKEPEKYLHDLKFGLFNFLGHCFGESPQVRSIANLETAKLVVPLLMALEPSERQMQSLLGVLEATMETKAVKLAKIEAATQDVKARVEFLKGESSPGD